MTANRTIFLAALVALVQIAFLGWSIMGRAAVLRDGREVVLKVEPVDPRDFLRGDYVRLGYDIGQVPSGLLAKPLQNGRNYSGEPVWVRLEKRPDGYWGPVSVSVAEPFANPAGPDQVDVKGVHPQHFGITGADLTYVPVEYGIGRYYVPEGEGLAIEEGLGKRPFAILAAVGGDGALQIKALMDGDTKLYEEPWY